MDRRNFMALAGAGAAGLMIPGALRGREQLANKHPNIIVILADDLGYGDVCCYGRPEVSTPNISLLAKQGIKFTDGYVTAPLCSPSRAGLLTGRYQQRFGHEYNAGGAARAHREGLGLPTSEITLSEVLKTAGYTTGMVGKWHLGSQAQFLPTNRGFDSYFGFLHGENSYVEPPLRSDTHTVIRTAGERRRLEQEKRGPHHQIYRNTEIVQEAAYLPDAFTREALSFIDQNADKLFFLYLAHNAPHTPLQATDKYYNRFPQIKDEKKRIYSAMVSAVDDSVGAILQKLKDLDIEENTIVFFLSDNGCANYIQACYNDPLNAGKILPFEGGLRVPFLVQWPGHFPAGKVVEAPVSSLDIFATAIGLAGAKIDRAIDGVNLVPFLTGKTDTRPHDALFWRSGPNKGMRKGKWKYINLNGKRTLLFDLKTDIGEHSDLSEEKPQVVKELEQALAEWESQLVAPLWPSRRILKISLKPYGLGDETYDFPI